MQLDFTLAEDRAAMYHANGTPGLARTADPVTSHQAAKTVNVTYLEGKVMDAIRSFPYGATQDDLVQFMELPSNSITPRFKPLLLKGAVYEAGTRKGDSGKNQRVLRAMPQVVVVAAESNSSVVRAALAEQEHRRKIDFAIQARKDAHNKLCMLTKTVADAVQEATRTAEQFQLSFAMDFGGADREYAPGLGWLPSSDQLL